jgi:hypothetical protein
MRTGQNHEAFCRSSGFTWFFNFSSTGTFVAKLFRLSQAFLKELSNERPSRVPLPGLPFTPDPTRDVQFIIGEREKGRNPDGKEVNRERVTLTEFQTWIKAALFLDQAEDGSNRHATSCGDLITPRQPARQSLPQGPPPNAIHSRQVRQHHGQDPEVRVQLRHRRHES